MRRTTTPATTKATALHITHVQRDNGNRAALVLLGVLVLIIIAVVMMSTRYTNTRFTPTVTINQPLQTAAPVTQR